MIAYEFLILSLLFLIPGTLIYALRPDLRGLIHVMALASLPFAATEWLFYPAYWTPKFLFDLADRIGFGIEDLLFVVGLAAFSSTAYPVFARKVYVKVEATRPLRRAATVLAGVFAMVALLLALGVPILYASVLVMFAGTAAMLAARRDLIVPSLLGGALSTAIYLALCLVFAAIVPGVFERTWRPSLFLPAKLLGVPLDELLYGFGAGVSGTAFPAYILGLRFTARSTATLSSVG